MAIKDLARHPPAYRVPDYPTSIPPSLLLLILDLHPLSWSLLSNPPHTESTTGDNDENGEAVTRLQSRAKETSLRLEEFINVLMVFVNSVLASSGSNQVVIYGATSGKSKMLYPPPYDSASSSSPLPNSYEPFRILDTRIEEGLRGMAEEERVRMEAAEGQGLNEGVIANAPQLKTYLIDPPAIVSALSKALCYINRISPPTTHTSSLTAGDTTIAQTAPDRLEPRVLIINATPGSPASSGDPAGVTTSSGNGGSGGGRMKGGYVGLMNCVFAAQKAKVPIDVLSLPPPYTNTAPPIFLQQASHLTEGVYWRWNGKGGLLQYLHAIYLPPPNLRKVAFSVPPQDAVDYRAVCFCHGDIVDVGFVCSVCLSIFCKPLPVCQMCKTRFPIKSLPTLRAMAEGISPIPIPEIVVPPTTKPNELKGRKGIPGSRSGAGSGSGAGTGAGAGGGTGASRQDAMEID